MATTSTDVGQTIVDPLGDLTASGSVCVMVWMLAGFFFFFFFYDKSVTIM
jgi:hypothetical protein